VLYAERLSCQLLIGWISGAAASAAGLAASYAWDLPTGATIVCAFGIALALAGVAHPFARGGRRARMARQMLSVARWCAAFALFVSATLLMLAPRADQPLLDAAEFAAPALRSLYMNSSEQALHRDAAAYADRYLRAAEQLNEREARSRFDAEPLDDYEVARISSFIKSYNEMRRGEEFVMREVRSRARARARWIAGALAIVLALLLTPGFFNRVRSMMPNKRAQAKPRNSNS
jgi:zinc/manganese transport system permease protein